MRGFAHGKTIIEYEEDFAGLVTIRYGDSQMPFISIPGEDLRGFINHVRPGIRVIELESMVLRLTEQVVEMAKALSATKMSVVTVPTEQYMEP
jgi:hypothetical protein